MHRVLLGLLLLATTLLAGCAGPSGPPVSAATVPQDAPSEAGDGDYNLTLRILEAGADEPLPDAAVVVYWGSGDEDATGGFELSGTSQGGPDGGTVEGVVRASNPSTPEPETTLTMRTDETGRATARAPANQVVGIVAWAPGYTEEWTPKAVTGDADTGGPVDFPLYQARIVETSEGEIGPAGLSPERATGSDHEWYPEQAPWGVSDGAHAGYVERLASLRVTLNWTNGVEGGGSGDLSIGVGATSSDPDVVQESDGAQAGPGEQREQLALATADVEEHAWPSSDRLYVGPGTSSAYAGPMGLSYELTTEAQFSPYASPAGGLNESPAPATPLVLLGLVGLALLVRRQG